MSTRPRIRTLKPEMWNSEGVGTLNYSARLLWVGLITLADDEGRLRALPRYIAGQVFPYDEDVTSAKIKRWLNELEGVNLILQYAVNDVPYVVLRSWRKHQRINRPTKSTLPEPPDLEIVEQNGLTTEEREREEGTEEKRGRAIPERVRREVAKRAGATPGATVNAPCHHCGVVGEIHWQRLANGKPSSWVTFTGLELDHLHPFIHGGEHTAENLVLACPSCNRSRGSRAGHGKVADVP